MSLDRILLCISPQAGQLRWHRLSSTCHSKPSASPAKARKLLFPQAREVDTLNDGWQAAISFWGGAQQPAHSSSSQWASAWHACMDRITPSLCTLSPHRQQPTGKDAHTHTPSLVLMHMQHTHAHAHVCTEDPFMCKPPLTRAPSSGQGLRLLPTVQLTMWQRCLAFKAHTADAASYLPGAAAACCCPMLLLFENQTLHSRKKTLAHCAFKMGLASIRGFRWLNSCLRSLHCSLLRMESASL